MTWAPCQRIVRADVPPAFRVRGIAAPIWLCWPGAALNAAADYSVDFSRTLDRSDRIVAVEVMAANGQIAWASVFGNLVTFWAQWLAAGPTQAIVSIRTALGCVFSATVSIAVGCMPSLILPKTPGFAPNAFLLGSAIVPDALGNPLILG